jgi:hypothetical protein
VSSHVGAELPSPRPQVQVAADLHVQVGDVSAHVTGEGTRLRVVTDDVPGFAAALLTASRRAVPLDYRSPRATLTSFGDALDDAGVTVDLIGPRGTVAKVGHGQHSALLARLTGARHLRLGRVRVVAPTLIQALNRRGKRPAR